MTGRSHRKRYKEVSRVRLGKERVLWHYRAYQDQDVEE
jgi:hypothetical protein